jgi:hypothetical protein
MRTWWPDQATCPRVVFKIRGAFVHNAVDVVGKRGCGQTKPIVRDFFFGYEVLFPTTL